MLKFKNLGGDHVDLEGRMYHRGDIITTHSDLHAAFGDKFLPLTEDPKKKEVDVAPVEVDSEREMKFGKDVTKAMFPEALNDGFRVFQRVRDFYVMDEDDLDTPLNKKRLTEKSVSKFIEKQI